MTPESTFVLLFAIATAVAIAVRRLPIPYTVALVVVGLGLGMLDVVEAPHLTKELLFAVILPGLIFEAAFNLDAREFWRNRRSIGSLAVPGVVVAIGLTAAVITPVMSGLELDVGFDWRYGLVFGALIAATDPIAVVALFKRLNVPHRLGTLVEGESLLNDGTSVVVFGLIVAYVSGAVSTPGGLLVQFFAVVGGGAVAGAVVGVAATQITKRIDEPMIEVTLTVIAAYGSFALAEEFHCSGVIATVVAGMLCGSYGRQVGMSPTTRLAVETFWGYAAFALNSIVFLLMGFEVRFGTLVDAWAQIVVAYIAALAGRLGVVAAVVGLLRPTAERLPVKWTAVLTWGGLRGALSMVLALALPTDFPHRQQLVTMTFGVVLLSLLVQGLSMSWLLRRLGIVHHADRGIELDRARGHLHVSDAALDELRHMERNRTAPADAIAALRQRYELRRDAAERDVSALHVAQAELRQEAMVRAVRHLLALERTRIADAASEGLLRAEVARELNADVDLRIARLDEGLVENPADLIADLPASDASA
jgi:CPA1 family monovalent cation:H+ antiporter